MKLFKRSFIISLVLAIITVSVNAADIQLESAPCYATKESITVAESLIGGILDEVKNGIGFADAKNMSNCIIFQAWLNHQTNGYSYGELTDIANNAIWQYRDMYLRPEYYAEKEIYINNLISDIVTNYKTGIIDYKTAEKQSYIRILQSINPSFDPATCVGDFCYWDVPPFDSALFTIARKLLLR